MKITISKLKKIIREEIMKEMVLGDLLKMRSKEENSPVQDPGLGIPEPAESMPWQDEYSAGSTYEQGNELDEQYPQQLPWSQLPSDLRELAILNRERFIKHGIDISPEPGEGEDDMVWAERSNYYFGLSQGEIFNHNFDLNQVDPLWAQTGYKNAKEMQQGHTRGAPLAWTVQAQHGYDQPDYLKDPMIQEIFRERGETLCWEPGCDWPFEGTWKEAVGHK